MYTSGDVLKHYKQTNELHECVYSFLDVFVHVLNKIRKFSKLSNKMFLFQLSVAIKVSAAVSVINWSIHSVLPTKSNIVLHSIK